MSFSIDSLNRKFSKLQITMKDGKAQVDHLHCVNIGKDSTRQAQEWCQERFGDNWIWSSPTQADWTKIYFRDKQDALIFSLAFAGLLTA